VNAMKVKVCGLTRNQDALLSEELGAWAVGVIFAPSPRQVSISEAEKVFAGLSRKTQRFGVFANSSIETILSSVDEAGLTGVQLHGQESQAFTLVLKNRRPQLIVMKAIEVHSPKSLEAADDFAVDYLLLDSPRNSTGPREKLDVESVCAKRPHHPFFIAGGLDAASVFQFASIAGSVGVDICSGIESAPGMKSPEKMKSFFKALEGGINES
jgi:phosphoribosylanthranilate isomerase